MDMEPWMCRWEIWIWEMGEARHRHKQTEKREKKEKRNDGADQLREGLLTPDDVRLQNVPTPGTSGAYR